MSPESKEIKISLVIVVLILIVIGVFYYNYKQNNKPPAALGKAAVTNSASAKSNPKQLTVREVAKHNQPSDCFVIVMNKVYNVTSFLDLHSGGPDRITPYCGADATPAFNNKGGGEGHSASALQRLQAYLVGGLSKQLIVNYGTVRN
ncbi:MAG: hypothetical protein HY973_02930 [Candidatus Kerfeldbacteria bacterium]|nr:hypothetical protein [Candidatus Kerfeldbacteria bacterium]